jgi:hypothetical protein
MMAAALPSEAGRRAMQVRHGALVKLIWGGYLVAAANELCVPLGLCHASGPTRNVRGVAADSLTARAHRARAIACYCGHIYGGLPQTAVAQALGVNRRSICYAVQNIENERDDATFDAMIERVARAVAGEAAP